MNSKDNRFMAVLAVCALALVVLACGIAMDSDDTDGAAEEKEVTVEVGMGSDSKLPLGYGKSYEGSVPGLTFSYNSMQNLIEYKGRVTTVGTYVVKIYTGLSILEQDLAYKITFNVIPAPVVTFSVSGSSYGSVSSTSLSVNSGKTFTADGNTITFSDGQSVTATPKASTSSYTYSFSGWSPSSGTIDGDTTITGSFTRTAVTPSTYSVTVYKGDWDSFKWYSGDDTTEYTSISHTYTVKAGDSLDIDWSSSNTSGSGSGTNYTYTWTSDSSCNNMATSSGGTSKGDSVTINSSGLKYYPATTKESTKEYTYTYSYTIKYNANGGSGAPSNTTATSTSSSYSASTSKSITLSSTKPTKSGSTFLGWSESSTATSATYQAGNSYSFKYGTTTLYAVWKEANLSIGAVSKQYAVVGDGVSFTASCTPSSGVTYSYSNATSGLTVGISGSTITLNAATPGTYTFTLTASASGMSSSSTTVTVEFVPVLAFSNAPDEGQLTVW